MMTSCLVAAVGSIGGLLGGGGSCVELLLAEERDTSTKVLPALASLGVYSQQGSTLCPEGAVSNW